MDRILHSLFFFLLLTPFLSEASTAVESRTDDEVVVSIVDGTAGPVTQTQTFVPTTYSSLATLSTTITTATVVTVGYGTSTVLSTYHYEIGPGGIGWILVSGSQASVPLPPPTFLPGHPSSPHPQSPSTRDTSLAGISPGTMVTDSGRSTPEPTGSNVASASSSTAFTTLSTGSDDLKTPTTGRSISIGTMSTNPSNRATPGGGITSVTTIGGPTPSSSTSNGNTSDAFRSSGITPSGTWPGATPPSSRTSSTGTPDTDSSSQRSLSRGTPASSQPSSGTPATVSSYRETSTGEPSSVMTSPRGTSAVGQSSSETTANAHSSSETLSSTSSAGGQSSIESSFTDGYSATGGHTASATTSSILSTITNPPIGFSASTMTETSIKNNTWATTTDKKGHSTIVPVIMASGKPVILWGLPPVSNTEFKLPNLPSFNLPCIKVFGAPIGQCPSDPVSGGENPDQPEPSHSRKQSEGPSSTKATEASKTDDHTTSASVTSSEECTATKTVSNCEVNCAKYTTGNSCVSSTTTCSQTRTGCSVTGVTSTMSTSTSESSSYTKCFERKDFTLTDAPDAPEPTLDPSYDEGEVRRRKHARDLKARAFPFPIEVLGPQKQECTMTPGKASTLTRPGWPFPSSQILEPDLAGNLNEEFKTLSRYYIATATGECDVPTLVKVDASGFTNAPTYTNMANKEVAENKTPSLDHAYEKSWLKSFFGYVLETKLSCQDFNIFFFPKAKSGTNPEQHSMLQPIWDALPSNDPANLDFILMSQYINGAAKAKFFPEGWQPMVQTYLEGAQMKKFIISTQPNMFKWKDGKSPSENTPARGVDAEVRLRTMLASFETGLLGCLAIKADPTLDLMRKTNQRIWNKLKDLDSKMENPGCNNIDLTDDQVKLWKSTFPKGMAEFYKDFMTAYIEKQVNEPPNYLVRLWEERIASGVATARDLPNVAKDSVDPGKTGVYYKEWEQMDLFVKAIEALYKPSGSYEWLYTFSFTWEEEVTNQKRANSCPVHTASTSTTTSTEASTSKPESKSEASDKITSKTTFGASSDATTTRISTTTSGASLSRTSSGERITSTSHSTSTNSASTVSTDPATDTGSTSTRTSKSTAPAITVGTTEEKVDECSQGWGTYDVAAKATAPANADSQKFYIPAADRYVSADWEASFMDGFIGKKEDFDPKKLVDPRTVVKSWTVKTAADDTPVAKGEGGKSMQIKWKSPEKANGTYIELTYVDKSLEQQEWGIRAQGGKSACMPDHCSDPPKEITDDNGRKCKKYPCSTQLSCEDSGEIRPHSECLLIEDGIFFPLWYDVSIVTNNWIHDDGKKLKSEEKGCGVITDWHRKDIQVNVPDATGYNGGWTAVNRFTFSLPWTIASGCVERAIASAGGPKNLQCVTQTSDWVFKRSLVGSIREALPTWARVF